MAALAAATLSLACSRGDAGSPATDAGATNPVGGGRGGVGGQTAGAAAGGATAAGGVAGDAGSGAAAGTAGGALTSDVCNTVAENATLTLSCPAGQTISDIVFASFGTPAGACGSLAAGSCAETASVSVVQALCVGRQSCSVPANTATFGDPCHGTVKTLAVDATCATAGAAAGPAAGQQPFKGVANSPCADRTSLNVSWYYNWEQTENEACADGKGGVFVPMVWGHTGSEQSASGIASAVASFVGKGYPYVLGFNEPDNSSQSAIAEATAISLWPSFGNAAIAVVSPATQANSTGQSWFDSFMSDVNAGGASLRTDVIALHWYGWNAGSCDAAASQLDSYLKWAEGIAGNRPIWLTEWGCLHDSAPDEQTVVSFYNGALATFARHPRLQRYAWYPWSTNLALTNADGSLTTLGTAFAAAPAYK